jgi:DNA-binding NarL/FixJ family response regulator
MGAIHGSSGASTGSEIRGPCPWPIAAMRTSRPPGAPARIVVHLERPPKARLAVLVQACIDVFPPLGHSRTARTMLLTHSSDHRDGVLIIEDDDFVRGELEQLVGGRDDFRVDASVGSVENARRVLAQTRARFVILDPGQPDGDALEVIPQARDRGLEVLVLTVRDGVEEVVRALRLGAGGYLRKSEAGRNVVDALVALRAGHSPMSPSIARALWSELGPRPTAPDFGASVLTTQEREVLESLRDGSTYAEVGVSLNISINTVRAHVRNIYRKLEVSSRHAALARVPARD